MLEIIRGRTWAVSHTVLDAAEGPPSDLSVFARIVCQVREKTATRNAKGFFEHRLVATPTVVLDDSILWLRLSVADIGHLHTGDYLIDVVGQFADGTSESILDPEPVRVVNRPTQPGTAAVVPPPVVPPEDLPIYPPVVVIPPTVPAQPDPLVPVNPATLIASFTVSGSDYPVGGQHRFRFYHETSRGKFAYGVCYRVDGGTAVFVPGGYRPPGDDLAVLAQSWPVPWSPGATSTDASFVIPYTAGANKVVEVWAATSATSGPTTQLATCSVSTGRLVAFSLVGSPLLEVFSLEHGASNALALPGGFSVSGKAGLKVLNVWAGDLAGNLDYSAFTGLKRLSVTGGPFVTAVVVAPLALEVIPNDRYLGSPSMLSNCGLDAAALNTFFTSLIVVPETGAILIDANPGTNSCNPVIASLKGYQVLLTQQALSDYINSLT